MLMEQEAPLLFHTVFAGAVILTVAYLLHWRGHSPQKKPLELILYFCYIIEQGYFPTKHLQNRYQRSQER